MKSISKIIFSVLISTAFLIAPTFPVLAQTPESQLAQGFVQCEGTTCSACDLIALANTMINWLITISFLFFAVLAVRAGFKLITSQGNSGALSDAKQSFTNAFVGLVIILLAFLAVDTLMRKLIAKDGVITGYGPWSEVRCAEQVEPGLVEGYYKGDLEYVPGQPMSSYTGPAYKGGALPQCASSNPACSVAALKAAGFSDVQANIMSCIAMSESSGNPSTPPYNVTHPNHRPLSTACGLFQITQSTWKGVATGECKSFSMCTNARCNTQNAIKLVKQSGYTPWTCPGCNNKAAYCVRQYGG